MSFGLFSPRPRPSNSAVPPWLEDMIWHANRRLEVLSNRHHLAIWDHSVKAAVHMCDMYVMHDDTRAKFVLSTVGAEILGI